MTTLSKVLIADDHVLIRDGLKHSLISVYDDVKVVEAKNGEEVLNKMEQEADFTLILLDLYMPDTDGIQLLANLCDYYPETPIIVLSATEEQATMRKVLDCGASGFIPKSTSQQVMLSAIQLVISGGVYIPPHMLKENRQTDNNKHKTTIKQSQKLMGSDDAADLQENVLNQLTERQKDVFSLMVKGMQNKEIARELELSEHTVKVHVTAILKVLDVANRTQAVLVARNIGIK